MDFCCKYDKDDDSHGHVTADRHSDVLAVLPNCKNEFETFFYESYKEGFRFLLFYYCVYKLHVKNMTRTEIKTRKMERNCRQKRSVDFVRDPLRPIIRNSVIPN